MQMVLAFVEHQFHLPAPVVAHAQTQVRGGYRIKQGGDEPMQTAHAGIVALAARMQIRRCDLSQILSDLVLDPVLDDLHLQQVLRTASRGSRHGGQIAVISEHLFAMRERAQARRASIWLPHLNGIVPLWARRTSLNKPLSYDSLYAPISILKND